MKGQVFILHIDILDPIILQVSMSILLPAGPSCFLFAHALLASQPPSFPVSFLELSLPRGITQHLFHWGAERFASLPVSYLNSHKIRLKIGL
jgi:hypothetical protein